MIFLRYYIPARRINVAKLGLFIRKDWLDKLNMAEPTTTEEWVAYLRAAKEAKLGGEQTVPYAMKLYENSPLFSTSVIVDSFLDFSKITKEDWYSLYHEQMPGAKEAYRLLNTLYNEGLISENFAIDNGGENAGAALLDACKEVKTSDPVQIGSYRGYAISVEFSAWKQEYTLLLKGQMTHRATLGTDPRGNLTRIDNALAQMPQRLEAAKAQLDNLYQQQAAAKEEVGKPFLYEEELRSKNTRLVELDTLLNIDGKGQAHAEAVVAKSARPSVLDHLKRPVPPRSTDKKPKQHEEVR